MKPSQILVIDDHLSDSNFLDKMFVVENIQMTTVTSTQLSSYIFPEDTFQLILFSMYSPYHDSLELLKCLSRQFPDSKIIVIVDSEGREMVITAMQMGAYSYIERPLRPELFLHRVQHILEVQDIKLAYRHTLLELNCSQSQLQDLLSRVEALNQELMESRHLLSAMVKNIDRTKRNVQKQIVSQIKHLIFPLIDEISRDRDLKKHTSKFDSFVNHIEDLDSDSFTDLSEHTSLSPRELRIALMIKYGMTSHEIAERLHIMPTTVKTHRRNIRRKLGVRGVKKHLRAFIQTLDHPGSDSSSPLDLGVGEI